MSLIKFLFPLCACLFTFTSVSAQERFVNKAYSFSMLKPTGWIEKQNADLLKNLNKYKIGSQELNTIIAQHKNSLLLTSYYKYNPQEHAGLIPTINVMVRQNTTKDFISFMTVIKQSAESMKQVLNNMNYIKRPEAKIIDGVKSVYFINTFTMTLANGTSAKVRSRNYAIPRQGYFLQISLIDEIETEDASSEYNKIENSIKLENIN